MSYQGSVYKAPSGQWAWVITEDGEDVVRGAGYDTEQEAEKDLEAELAHLAKRDLAGGPTGP